MKDLLKKIPGITWLADIFNSIIIIIKYSIGFNVKIQDERADPKDPEWDNNPWAMVFEKRCNYAKNYSVNKDVLDLCCGTGWTTFEISKICNSIIGVDSSENAIQCAKSNYMRENISFKKMNALSLHFQENTFDTVVSMEAIEHFTKSDGIQFILEAYRVLKKRGIFIGSTPQIENRNPLKILALKKIDPFHLYLYSKSILEITLSQFFPKVEVTTQKEGWLLFVAVK